MMFQLVFDNVLLDPYKVLRIVLVLNSFQVLGPSGVTAMKGKLIELCVNVDNSIFAFSAASVRRCKAWLS